MVRELEQALDTLSARQRVISNNVANLNTPGFKRSDIDFFDHLKQVYTGAQEDAKAKVDELTPVRLDGNNVSIEREMFALSQTELMYQAASRFTTAAVQRLTYAITDGRG